MSPSRLDRLAPPARLVDWSILTLVALEVGSGLVSLVAGTPDWGWLFVVHSVGGVTLLVMLFFKFRRVRPRVTKRSLWDGGTPVSILLGTLALAAFVTGTIWALTGVVRIGRYTLLTVHMVLGVLVVPVLLWHLRHRFRWPNRRTVDGRREAIRFTALVGFGAVTWRLKEVASSLVGLAGADRRFTGSTDAEGEGNDFPVTSWVADDPDPVDVADWSLAVDGEVERALAFDYGDLTGVGDSERRALLDCTSGWYAERDWRGVRVGDLLAETGTTDAARWVRFVSVTGYRWSLPIEEAQDALLATHVDGQRLTHGHGAPLRLVAPGRRGFQWVKWVERVDVTRSQDLGQWIAIFVSGFD
ncbi:MULTISPECIES: molybdopterin-dependent oxidoreductase [Salinibaculum]|uniref:molybdopterin-dependent oxidoreductase n=1 Tax=Salinibaculum TaxID=2732368 RepID=UPI0030CE8186